MGLFDDEFYSSKVSYRERRRVSKDLWPAWRSHTRWTPTIVIASVIGVIVLLVIVILLWSDPAEEDGRETNIAQTPTTSQPVGVVDVVQRMKPAIVSVISMQNGYDQQREESGIGSGIIYRLDGSTGRVVTNHHVIEGASSVEIVLSNGERLEAEVVGSDALTDLAVLKVESRKMIGVAQFGDSDLLQEGEAAIAIGHPFGLGYSPTFTLGIISSLDRVIPISLSMDESIDWEMRLLQTDAAINHGNSGGALVNLDGKVIGINSMKVSQYGVEGLGFAIPINQAIPIISELEKYGKVRRPYLGVATVDLKVYVSKDEESNDNLTLPEDVEDGAIVLESYGPAEEAGIKTNDIIVALDGKPISSTLDLRKYLYGNKKINESILVDFYRDGKRKFVDVKLIETPEK